MIDNSLDDNGTSRQSFRILVSYGYYYIRTLLPHSVQIIYASTSGNVETVCEYVGKVVEGHHYDVALHRAEITDADVLIKNHLFILATSTWEHGEINPFFNKLLDAIAHLDLKDKYFGFIGLGDRRYEPVLFCGGMETLRDAVIKSGGIEIGEPLRIEGEPHQKLETEAQPWTHHFISEVINMPKFRMIDSNHLTHDTSSISTHETS